MNKNLFFILGLPLILSSCGSPESHIDDKISCHVDILGSFFVDYYKQYENEDWSGEEDTKYNITINHKWTLTYPAKFPYQGDIITTKLGDEGKDDIAGTSEITAIVPYTKTGSKFIPDFSQHWSQLQIREMPEIIEVMNASINNNDGDFLLWKSECTIENIVEKK